MNIKLYVKSFQKSIFGVILCRWTNWSELWPNRSDTKHRLLVERVEMVIQVIKSYETVNLQVNWKFEQRVSASH